MSLLPWRWSRRGAARDASTPQLPSPTESEVDRAAARQARIALREERDAAAREPSMLLTTRTFPIYYLPITKCGCTFLKNLFYALDHGAEHPAGVNVHEQEEGLLHAAGHDYQTVFDSPYSFTVLRDPAARFMSFYFDKIWGEGAVNFPKIRTHLQDAGVVDLTRDLSVEEHRANVHSLLDWVTRNLQGETDLAINYHWRPQTSRLRRARMFKLNHLTLEGLDWQLPMLMAPVVPDMEQRMQAVKARNRSQKPMPMEDVLDDDLTAAIRKLYRADTILHDRARRAWAGQDPARRQGEPASPPMPRHRRVRRITSDPATSLTAAAMTKGHAVWQVLGTAGLAGEDIDLRFDTVADVPTLVLMREPVERFGAIYAEMVLRPRRSGFGPLRTTLVRRRGMIAAPETVEDHEHNLTLLAGYMRRRKAEYIEPQGYARTRQQSHDIRRLIAAGATVLFSDRLERDLPVLLQRPELADPLKVISAATELPANIAAALTGAVADAVQSLYRADCDLYDSLRETGGVPVAQEGI